MYNKNAYLNFSHPGNAGLSAKPWYKNAVAEDMSFAQFRQIVKKSLLRGKIKLKSAYANLTELNNLSRLYISAHGREACDFISDSLGQKMGYQEFANILSYILIHPSLKQNQATNLKLSLIVCSGGSGTPEKNHRDSFAALLQHELRVRYGIFVTVVARTYSVMTLANKKTVEVRNIDALKSKIKTIDLSNEKALSLASQVEQQMNNAHNEQEKLQCRAQLKEIESVIVINHKNIEKIRLQAQHTTEHHYPSSKVIYQWQPNGSRIRYDAYAEVYTQEWRQSLLAELEKYQTLSLDFQKLICDMPTLRTETIESRLAGALKNLQFNSNVSVPIVLEAKLQELKEQAHFTKRVETCHLVA